MSNKAKGERGVDKAVAHFGSQEALADAIGVKKQSVQKWVTKGYVPLDRLQLVADLTGVATSELLDPKIKAVV